VVIGLQVSGNWVA